MAAIVTRGLGANSAFIRQVRKQAASVTERKMQAIAQDAERRADEIVQKEYVTDRPSERRRPGRHLLGSFHAEVEWNGQDFPVAVTLRSSAPMIKVNSLNFGSDPHAIQGNPKLSFPNTQVASGSFAHVPSAARFAQAYGTQRKKGKKGGVANVVVKKVQHPGTGAGFFLQRALEAAVQAAYRQAINLKR